jgi:hypothetical protein
MIKKRVLQALSVSTMLLLALSAEAGSNVDNTLTSTVVSKGAFSQTFKVTTGDSYQRNGSITVFGLENLFGAFSLNLQSGGVNLFQSPLLSVSLGNTEKVVFKDQGYQWDLAPSSTYTLFVSGTAELANVSYSLRASQLQVSPVPEPETYSMLLAGLGVVGAIGFRRSRPV